MAKLAAGLLVPGVEYHDLIIRSLTTRGDLDIVTMRTLVVVRNDQIPAGVTTPECNVITAINDDTGERVVTAYLSVQEVELKPKPSKWRKIWTLLWK